MIVLDIFVQGGAYVGKFCPYVIEVNQSVLEKASRTAKRPYGPVR